MNAKGEWMQKRSYEYDAKLSYKTEFLDQNLETETTVPKPRPGIPTPRPMSRDLSHNMQPSNNA